MLPTVVSAAVLVAGVAWAWWRYRDVPLWWVVSCVIFAFVAGMVVAVATGEH